MHSPEDLIAAEVVNPPNHPNRDSNTRRLIEQLLSPEAIQRMMMCGGGVLVLGFIGWLWSIGVFENPVVVAATLGTITLSVLAAGVAMVRYTRYQLAGTGMSLLASLAMPLNLWFYDAQGLITLKDGGHLWIPAAVCCVIYALVARALRKPTFVYAFVGGIVLTGMLFLADLAVGRFWQLMPPATFLVIAGWLCIHAERLFGTEGDFSKASFGKAFRISGVAVLTAGLGVILGGQLAALFHDWFQWLDLPAIATDRSQKIWALVLLGCSAGGCLFEFSFDRSRRAYAASAFGLAAWCVVSAMDIFAIPLRLPYIAIAFCGWLVANNLFDGHAGRPADPAWLRGKYRGIAIQAATHGLLAAAFWQVFAATGGFGNRFVLAKFDWIITLQLVCTAVAAFSTGLRVARWRLRENAMFFRLAGVSVATLAALSVPVVVGIQSLDLVAACGLVIPVVCALWTLFHYQEPTPIKTNDDDVRISDSSSDALQLGLFGQLDQVVPVATSVGVFMTLLSVLGLWLDGQVVVYAAWLTPAWILAVASFALLASARGAAAMFNQVFGAVTAIGAGNCLLGYIGIDWDYSLVLSATFTGVVLAASGYWKRFSGSANEVANEETPANLLVLGGTGAGMLLALSRMVDHDVSMGLLWMMGAQLFAILVTSLMTKSAGWRATFRAAGLANCIATVCVINSLINTTFIHKFELGTILVGISLLVIGHISWYREGDKKDQSATDALLVGSLMTTVPLLIGLAAYRSFDLSGDTSGAWNWMLFHEITVLLAGFALLAAGLGCKIRFTTIAGATLLGTYVLSLVALLRMPTMLNSVSTIMMIGGGSCFLIAVGLSVYRDRIMSLPSKIREGDGVFRVLHWR